MIEDLQPGDVITLPDNCPASHWILQGIWWDEKGEVAIDVIEVYRDNTPSAPTSILPWERKKAIPSRSDI
jgi:hypothetical protein